MAIIAFNQAAKIINVVLTYWIVSISMVFFNKYLVGGGKQQQGQPDISIFVAWVQCLFSVIVILVYFNVGASIFKSSKSYAINTSLCKEKSVLQVSFLFSLMLSSNNYCLKLVGVAFFQIARSFTLIFTVMFSALILRSRVSCKVVLSCLVVVLGFLIGVDQEQAAGTLTPVGIASGLVSSLFVALNGIYTKKALRIDEMDSVKLMLHVNANASILLLLPAFFTGQITNMIEMGKLTDPMFWLATCVSGILGFLIGWASTRQIEYTSPVTHHISNNTKSILQSLLAVWVYQDYKTGFWWFGCCVVLLGAFVYTMVKMREERSTSNRVVIATHLHQRTAPTNV